MYYTREKRQRMRKRRLRRIIRRIGICGIGILFLTGVWKLTSFALHHLSPEKDSELVFHKEEAYDSPDMEASSEVSGTTGEEILLVNKDHPLPETYRPTMKKLRDYGIEVDTSIYHALNDMLKAGEREGLTFWIASGYRSPERQRELLDEDIEELVQKGWSYSKAYEEVVKETMPVGCSEHATGLAVDIVAKDYQILDEKQADTAEIKWLQKNCSQYGFILRYPEGKEDITQVSYESWHFRYVGMDAAKDIMSQGITLEEYLEARAN